MNELQETRHNFMQETRKEEIVPKTVHGDQSRRIDDAISKLKSDLEVRIFEEHPDEASIDRTIDLSLETIVISVVSTAALRSAPT